MFALNAEKCDGCGTCVDGCASGAISLENEKASINEDECAECGVCVDECPNGAIFEK